jgi:hypothetical protein
MSCCASQNAICPCGEFVHPAPISNVAGLSAIAYRVGDYTSFREALLRALPGEVSLTATQAQSDGTSAVVQLWRPGATGDLAVQMMEWWAYLADILTFYNQRAASQAYLRTADQSITVNRLVRLLGYRPKPGIGAEGSVAALMNGTATFTLPQGFQIQSKPGPGLQPQIFEVNLATTIQSPDMAAIGPTYAAPSYSSLLSEDGVSVLLSGVVTSVKANDQLLLLQQGWNGAANNQYSLVKVQKTAPEQDPWGNTNTRVTFSSVSPALPSGDPSGYRLLKSTQSAHLSSLSGVQAISGSTVALASVVRQIKVGDPVLVTGQVQLTIPIFEEPLERENFVFRNPGFTIAPSPPTSIPACVTSYSEVLANLPGASPAVAVWYTSLNLTFASALGVDRAFDASTVQIAFAFQDVGTLIGTPSTTLTGETLPLTPPPTGSLPANSTNLMIEDANGNGVQPSSSSITTSNPPSLNLSSDIETANPPLAAPARVLLNLVSVSRGKTVANETLGNGNAAIAGQDFMLQNSPVTYLQDSPGISGDGYSSTVQVWVNNVEWMEVRSFYGQPANAQIFITKEDEQGQTHVIFGDGTNGARLPTGVNNIVATYRYGSGASAPAAASLTGILKPLPGLKAIRNPVQVSGGADPDPPDQVRQYAPGSVLTFSRAVSMDDFQAAAGATSGVTRAQAVFGLNPISQRPQILVYVVPGNSQTQSNAQSAIAKISDPNRLPAVLPATPIHISISATLVLAPNADSATVLANATDALAGQNGGLFVLDPNSGSPAQYILGIGQPVYNSQIFAALTVPGVQAVENFSFSYDSAPFSQPIFRFTTFRLPIFRRMTFCQLQRHDPQAGKYFVLEAGNPSSLNLVTAQPNTTS